jgi:ATP-dependent 26S proteasome regulatory subunit
MYMNKTKCHLCSADIPKYVSKVSKPLSTYLVYNYVTVTVTGTPMSVGSLEEIIDDNHAIVSTSVGSEHYVSILSFVDKDQLEPGRFRTTKLSRCPPG